MRTFFKLLLILSISLLLLLTRQATAEDLSDALDLKWLKKRGFSEDLVRDMNSFYFFGQWDRHGFEQLLKKASILVNSKNGTHTVKKKLGIEQLKFTIKNSRLHGRVLLKSNDVDVKAYFSRGKLNGRVITRKVGGNSNWRTQCQLRYRRGLLHGRCWCRWGVGPMKIYASFRKGKLHGKTWVNAPYLRKPRYFYKGRPCGVWKNPENYRKVRFRCRRK